MLGIYLTIYRWSQRTFANCHGQYSLGWKPLSSGQSIDLPRSCRARWYRMTHYRLLKGLSSGFHQIVNSAMYKLFQCSQSTTIIELSIECINLFYLNILFLVASHFIKYNSSSCNTFMYRIYKYLLTKITLVSKWRIALTRIRRVRSDAHVYKFVCIIVSIKIDLNQEFKMLFLWFIDQFEEYKFFESILHFILFVELRIYTLKYTLIIEYLHYNWIVKSLRSQW